MIQIFAYIFIRDIPNVYLEYTNISTNSYILYTVIKLESIWTQYCFQSYFFFMWDAVMRPYWVKVQFGSWIDSAPHLVDVMIWKHISHCRSLKGGSTGHRWIPLTKDQWCRAFICPLLLACASCGTNSFCWWFEKRWRSCVVTVMNVRLTPSGCSHISLYMISHDGACHAHNC